MHSTLVVGGMFLSMIKILTPLLLFVNLPLTFGNKVICDSTESFPLHTQGSIKCTLTSSEDPLIITWQKNTQNIPINVATISRTYGVNIQPAFTQKVNVSFVGSRETIFTISNVSMLDQGCYTCLFHLFSSGVVRQKTCIKVQTELVSGSQSRLSENKLEVSCHGTGYPAPIIFWDSISQDHIETTSTTNEDGTVTVTSVASISPPPEPWKSFSCKIQYNGSNLTLTETFTNQATKNTGLSISISLILAFTIGCCIVATVIGIIFYVVRDLLRENNCTFFPPLNGPFTQLISINSEMYLYAYIVLLYQGWGLNFQTSVLGKTPCHVEHYSTLLVATDSDILNRK